MKTLFDKKIVQSTEEAFSPQKRTSSTSKNEIYQFFSMFVGHFVPRGSGSNQDPDTAPGTPSNPDRIWTRIRSTALVVT